MKQNLQNKKKLVQNVFNKVYDKYDLMNDFMSIGIHRLWKKDMINWMAPFPKKNLIDMACGTGDLGRAADCSLAEETLGWKPKIGLEEGLKMTYEWAERFLKSYPSMYNQ